MIIVIVIYLFLNKWEIATYFMAISFLNYHMVKFEPPINGTLVACDYPKCSHKCSRKLGFHIILRIIHGNGLIFLA
jgi:hypothetical protein